MDEPRARSASASPTSPPASSSASTTRARSARPFILHPGSRWLAAWSRCCRSCRRCTTSSPCRSGWRCSRAARACRRAVRVGRHPAARRLRRVRHRLRRALPAPHRRHGDHRVPQRAGPAAAAVGRDRQAVRARLAARRPRVLAAAPAAAAVAERLAAVARLPRLVLAVHLPSRFRAAFKGRCRRGCACRSAPPPPLRRAPPRPLLRLRLVRPRPRQRLRRLQLFIALPQPRLPEAPRPSAAPPAGRPLGARRSPPRGEAVRALARRDSPPPPSGLFISARAAALARQFRAQFGAQFGAILRRPPTTLLLAAWRAPAAISRRVERLRLLHDARGAAFMRRRPLPRLTARKVLDWYEFQWNARLLR